MLIMDEATKTLAECVVRERNKMHGINMKLQKSVGLDLIAAKGEGCIFLCYGPPGTGKTLTAECLAEKLHRPLWSLSVSQLGTTPQSLEVMLMRVMEVAAYWGALLLLDEADVYLERRKSSDLVRNAMVGVFLRQLEYYRGVLFLTTNRDFAFDEAFCSRISVFLRYENLTEDQRYEIWRNILNLSGMINIPSEEDIAEFARCEFNGREIRNVMQMAQTVARSKVEPLDAQHIKEALEVLEASIDVRASSRFKNKPAICN
jgi:SpoVK/Ycf46/Vps4 family AAA+-type ATPase